MTATTTPRAHSVTVTPKPDGCDLDVRPYARDLLTDVIALLAESPELMDNLDRVVAGGDAPDPYQPERHLPTEHLVEQLLAALPASATAIRLHGPQLDRLADNLATISAGQTGPKAVAA
jgi:hypothetical protein